jgi:putative SOS response-associated peptidase YedK
VWDRWLDPALVDLDALAHMIVPRSPALVAYPVSSHVNDPRNDDPACFERQEPQQPEQGSLF